MGLAGSFREVDIKEWTAKLPRELRKEIRRKGEDLVAVQTGSLGLRAKSGVKAGLQLHMVSLVSLHSLSPLSLFTLFTLFTLSSHFSQLHLVLRTRGHQPEL